MANPLLKRSEVEFQRSMEESQKTRAAIMQEQETIVRSVEEAKSVAKDLSTEVTVVNLGLIQATCKSC